MANLGGPTSTRGPHQRGPPKSAPGPTGLYFILSLNTGIVFLLQVSVLNLNPILMVVARVLHFRFIVSYLFILPAYVAYSSEADNFFDDVYLLLLAT